MTEALQEIEEILDHILKSDSLTVEECSEAQAKFQMTFLTLDNKEEFLPFLNSYLAKLSEQFQDDEEKINPLKFEIDRFYDNIPTSISLYRIAGHKDPNDKDQSEVKSRDIDNSFEDYNNLINMGNMETVNIPDKDRPCITKVLQNLSILFDQKQGTKTQFITKWRYLRLANTIEKLKVQIPAVFTIRKFISRKLNHFHTFKKLALDDRKSELNSPSRFVFDGSKKKDLFSERKISEKSTPIIKAERKPTLKSFASITSVNPEIDFAELTKKLKEKDEAIKQLQAEIKRLTPAKTIMAKNLSEQTNFEEQVKAFKAKILALESRILELNRDNETKRTLLNDQFTTLLDKKNFIEKLQAEIKALRTKDKKTALNDFGKLRFLLKVMKQLQLKFMANGMSRLIKRVVKANNALANVGLRMKARLLEQTRQLSCGKDMHRNFLKWYIRSDNSVLRDYITKICISCKINNTTAIYRMKKLINRPSRNQLSAAIKMLHRCKAATLLHDLFAHKGALAKKKFVDSINPNAKTPNQVLLETVVSRFSLVHGKAAKKIVFNVFLKRLNREQRMLREIMHFWKIKKRVCFLGLKSLNSGKKNLEKLALIGKGLHEIEKLRNRKVKMFLDRIKDNVQKSLPNAIDKLAISSKFKLMTVLNNLRKHHNKTTLEQTTSGFNSNLQSLKKKNLAQMLVSNLRKKMYHVLTELKFYNQTETKMKERRAQLGTRVLMNFAERMKNLKGQALKLLKNNRKREINLKNKRRLILNVLVNAHQQKKSSCYNKFHDLHNQIESKKIQERNSLVKFLNKLKTKSNQKCALVIKKLRKNNKLNHQKNQKIQNSCLEKIADFKNQILKNALKKLIGNSMNIASQKKEKEDKSAIMRSFMNRMRLKLLSAFKTLRSHAKIQGAEQSVRKNQISKVLKSLKIAQDQKLFQSLNKLEDLSSKKRDETLKKAQNIERFGKLLKLRCKDKVKSALNNLRNFTKLSKNNEKTSTDNKKRILGNMIVKITQLKKNALDKLTFNKNHLNQMHFKNQTQIGKVLSKLKSSASSKLKTALANMKHQRKSAIFSDLTKQKTLTDITSRFRNNLLNSKRDVLKKLMSNNVISSQLSKSESDKKKRFIDRLLKMNDKKRQAFHKLISTAKILIRQHKSKNTLLKNVLGKIVNGSFQKMRKTMIMLHHLKNNKLTAEQFERQKTSYHHALQSRKKRGLLFLLTSSQFGKMQCVVNSLLRKLNMKKLEEAKIRERNKNKLQKIFNNINHKMALAFQKLISNKKLEAKIEKEKEDKQAKVMSLLGSTSANKEQSKFDALINNLKKLDKMPSKDYHFESFCNYLNSNNRRGKFDNMIRLVQNKELTNLKDMLNYALDNNSNGVYDELIERINDKNREAHDILKKLKRSNANGAFTDLIKMLEKNPKMTKTDVINFIVSTNKDGTYDALKDELDGNKKVDEVMAIMRHDNKDGKYDKALSNIKRLKDPKLSDLVNFLAIDKHSNYGQLKDLINKEDEVVTPDSLISMAKDTNKEGQLDGLIKYASDERVPTLIDLYNFMKSNNQNGRFNNLIDKINETTIDPEVQNLISSLDPEHHKNVIEKIAKYARSRPNCKVSDIIEFVNKNNLDKQFDPVVNALNKNRLNKYLEYMGQNNQAKLYDPILEFAKNQSNPNFFDLANKIRETNPQKSFNDIIDKINNEESLNDVQSLINSDPTNTNFSSLKSYLTRSTNPSMMSTIEFVSLNNRDDKLQPVIDAINEKKQGNALANIVYSLKKRNVNGKFDEILDNAAKNPSIKVTDLHAQFTQNNPDGKFNPILNDLDGGSNVVANDLVDSLSINNNDMKFDSEIGELQNLKSKTPTSICKYLQAKNNTDGLKIFDNLNPLAAQIDFMKKNNQDGLFNDTLAHIESISQPKLQDLIVYMSNKNKTQKFDSLLENIDATVDKKSIKMFLAKEPQRYSEITSLLSSNPDCKIVDIVNLAIQSNVNGQNDLLLDVINGTPKQKTISEIIGYLQKTNIRGKNDDLIEKLSKLPDQVLSKAIPEIEKSNDSHKHDDVVDFINCRDRLAMTDPINFMRNNNTQNRFDPILNKLNENDNLSKADLIDWVAKANDDKKMDDLVGFLNNGHKRNLTHSVIEHMRNNNSDGKYNDLLKEVNNGKANNLVSLMNLIKSKNTGNKYNHLIDALDELPKDKVVKNLVDYAKENNKQGDFSGFQESLRQIRKPRLLDIVDFLQKNSDDDKLDPLVELINGNSFPTNRMLNFLLRNNKDGRYNELIELLTNDPNASMQKIMECINKNNKNGEMDGFLKYLANGCHDLDDIDDVDADDLFKFLANARRKNQYPELIDLLKSGAIKNNDGLLDYLNKNNQNGRYDDLIERAKRFAASNNTDEKVTGDSQGLSLEKPTKQKMLHCLKRFKEVSNEIGNLQRIKLLKWNAILKKLVLKSRFKESVVLRHLRNTRDLHNKKIAIKNQKLSKILDKLLRAKKSKMATAVDCLRKTNNQHKSQVEKKSSSLKFLLSKILIAAKAKKSQACHALVARRRIGINKITGILGKLKSATFEKLNISFKKLLQKTKTLATNKANRSRVIRMLMKNQQSKLSESLKTLKKINEIKNTNSLKTRNLKSGIVARILNNMKNNQLAVLARLKLQTKKLGHAKFIHSANKMRALQKLVKASSIKTGIAWKELHNTNKVSKVQKLMQNKAISESLKKLQINQKAKLKSCFDSLLKSNRKAKTECEVKSKLTKIFGSKIILAQRLKMKQCFGNMRFNSSQKLQEKINIEKKTKFVFGKWKENRRLVLQLAFNTLVSNRRIIIAQKNQKDKERLCLKFMENQIAKNKKIDLAKTLQTLRTANQTFNKKKSLRENGINNICQRKNLLNQSDLGIALKKLRENAAARKGQEVKKKGLGEKLFKKLNEAKMKKLQRVLDKLRQNKNNTILSENAKKANKRRIIAALIAKSLSKSRQVLKKLKENGNAIKNKQLKKQETITKFCNSIVAKQNNNLGPFLDKLKAHSTKMLLLNRKKQNLTKRIFDKLVMKSQNKQRLFFTGAVNRIFALKSKKHLEKTKLKNMFGKMMTKKLLYCFEKLIVHSLKQRVKMVKTKAALNKQKNTSLVKSALIIGKLQNFKTARSLKFKYNARIFDSFVNGLLAKRKSYALINLCKNNLQKVSKQGDALKLIKKSLMAKMRNGYEKLKSINTIFKRNKLNNALSSMMFCLKKNHKVCMRKMLDVWSQKELKEKCQKLYSCLNNLVTKRVSFGLAKIKYEYGIWKYKKILKALMKLCETIEKIEYEKKNRAFKDMYAMFMDRNPWFKKIINILAINSHLSDQVSFWRMRYVKNLKRDSVTPMQAIKLKQLAQLFKRQESKNMNYGLWNLMKIMDMSISRASTITFAPKTPFS